MTDYHGLTFQKEDLTMTTAQLNITVPQLPALNTAGAATLSLRAFRRALAHRWDLFAIFTLLGSSAIAGISLLHNLAP